MNEAGLLLELTLAKNEVIQVTPFSKLDCSSIMG
jgi:hypothetical protein